jgi:hypothetical protein
VQLGLDGSAIIGSAYPSFGFGGRNSAGCISKLRLLGLNLASVPGGQLVNFPKTQSPDRWPFMTPLLPTILTDFLSL